MMKVPGPGMHIYYSRVPEVQNGRPHIISFELYEQVFDDANVFEPVTNATWILDLDHCWMIQLRIEIRADICCIVTQKQVK